MFYVQPEESHLHSQSHLLSGFYWHFAILRQPDTDITLVGRVSPFDLQITFRIGNLHLFIYG